MFDALLISENPQLIIELQKISAVTQCSLEVNHKVNNSEVRAAGTVLIDADLDIVINHPNVVVITMGEPGAVIWQRAAATSAKYVAFLPDAREWLLSNLIPQSTHNKRVIGIIGASGGLGTSLIASSLAIQFANEHNSVLLVEVSKYSGGLDVLWGMEDSKGTRWPDLVNPSGHLSAKDILRTLPQSNGVSILTTESNDQRIPKNISQILQELTDQCEVSIIDLPDNAHPEFESLIELCTEVVVVVGATIRSTNAANQLLTDYQSVTGIIVRNIQGSSLAAAGVAKTLSTKLLGQIPTDQKIVEHLEQGLNPALIPSTGYQKAISEIYQGLAQSNVRAIA